MGASEVKTIYEWMNEWMNEPAQMDMGWCECVSEMSPCLDNGMNPLRRAARSVISEYFL